MATRTSLTLLALAMAAPASAENVHRPVPYGLAHAYGAAYPYGASYLGGDGFAGEFVRGTYIGAPLTRVPRPTEIVPAPWSYGTYGVPTVTGIAAPPAAQPTLTVINGGPANGRRRAHAVEDGPAAGPQIIAVQVPRR